MNWRFKTKLEVNNLEYLKSRIGSKEYLQLPGMDFTEKNSHVATNTITCIILGITLYVMDDSDWMCEIVDAEAVFLDPYLEI